MMGIVLNFGIMLPTFLDEFLAGRTLTGWYIMIIYYTLISPKYVTWKINKY
jgi:membrane-anchored glycerophosphoryl diester phosphodiesterase (GDPDase)